MQGVPVVTGFIGRDRDGNVTTLGRSGSDFTATIVGRAIAAEEVQIWTDVSGVLTADPRLVPEARPVEHLTYGEASELAYYGGQGHPPGDDPAGRGETDPGPDPEHAGARGARHRDRAVPHDDAART